MLGKARRIAMIIATVLCAGTLVAAAACGDNKDTEYTVTYEAGYTGATETIPTESYAEGEQVTLRAADTFSRGGGYTFTKWSDGTSLYDAGATFTMPNHNVTFTAQWQQQGGGSDDEGLPAGTETIASFPQGNLTLINGDAKAHYIAEYTDGGLVIEAYVEDAAVDASGDISANDGVSVIFAQICGSRGYTDTTIRVRADAAGNVQVRNLGQSKAVTVEGLATEANYLTVDGTTVAGYYVKITMPYAAIGATQAAHDAAVALGLQDDGAFLYDESMGTVIEEVHTYLAVNADGTFAENPNLEVGLWGDATDVLTAENTWTLEHDDGTPNAYIQMTGHVNDNNIYMRKGATEFYAEVKLHADATLIGTDPYPKFGLLLTNADKSAGYGYYVDIDLHTTEDQTTILGQNELGKSRYQGGWNSWTNMGTKVDSTAYTGDDAYITLGIYRNGTHFQMYYGTTAGQVVTMTDVAEDENMYIGLFSFKIKLTVKDYSFVTDTAALATYRTTLDAQVNGNTPNKTIDGVLGDDWTAAQKQNTFVHPGTEGRSFTVYAAKDNKGVYFFYDVYHKNYVDDATDLWYSNTDIEVWIGRNQYYGTNSATFGHTFTQFKMLTKEESGLNHTTAEAFIAYSDLPASTFTAQSAYARAGFAFKEGTANGGSLWQAGNWWGVEGMNAGEDGEGIIFDENGIRGASSEVYTIDGETNDWGDNWTAGGESTSWMGSLEEDGLYFAVKIENAPTRNFTAGGDWWLNQGIELYGDNLHGAKIIYAGGKTYRSHWVAEAAAKFTEGADNKGTLVFEFFILREQLVNITADSQFAKVTVKGQRWPDTTTTQNAYYRTYFENVQAYAPSWTVTLQDELNGNSELKAVKGHSVTLTEPEYAGYTFDGWYVNGQGQKLDLGEYTPTADVTLVAKWNPIAPTITFNKGDSATGGGELTAEWKATDKKYEIKLPEAGVLEREGFTLLNFDVTVNGSKTTYAIGATVQVDPAATVVVDAVWQDNSQTYYTVTFTAEGVEDYNETKSVAEGQSVGTGNMPANPVREGYRFDKWVYGGETEFTAETTVSGDMQVSAKWVEQAKVTFALGHDEGGEPPAPVWVDKGKSIDDMAQWDVEMPANPARAAYQFVEWQQAGETKFESSTTVEDNITVTAQWKNLIDGVLDWTNEQKTNPFIIPGENGMKVTVYGYMDDFGVFIYYDVLHTVHKTTESEWHLNTNIEFRLGGDADKQYAKNAKGDYTNAIQEKYVYMHTDEPSGNNLYNTKAEVFVPYEDIGNGYNKNSAYVPARFMFKVGGLGGSLWVAGDWWRPEDTDANGNQGTLITRNGILKAQDPSVTIDGDESEWAGAQWTSVSKGDGDDRTIQWAYKFGTDGMYFAFKAEGSNLATEREYYNGAGWKNQNVEIQEGANSHRSVVAYVKGETYHTTLINEAKAKFTAAASNGGEKDKLVYEVFIAYPNLINMNAQSQSMTFNSGTQLFKTTDGVDANVWTVLAGGATLTRQA